MTRNEYISTKKSYFKKLYSHSDPIFKNLKILKIHDIHYLQQIQLYYKYISNLLLNYSTNFNFATNATVHRYLTRGFHQIQNSLVKHDFSRECIRYSRMILINTTPKIICTAGLLILFWMYVNISNGSLFYVIKNEYSFNTSQYMVLVLYMVCDVLFCNLTLLHMVPVVISNNTSCLLLHPVYW